MVESFGQHRKFAPKPIVKKVFSLKATINIYVLNDSENIMLIFKISINNEAK